MATKSWARADAKIAAASAREDSRGYKLALI